MRPSDLPRQNVLPAEQNVRRQRATRQPQVSNGGPGGVLSDQQIEQMLTPDEVNLPRRSTFPNQTGNSRPRVPPGPTQEEVPGTNPTHGPRPSPNPHPGASAPPTSDELDRMERWIALQERAAKIPAPLGHRFGVLKLSQNARAVRGTVRAGENIHVRVRVPEARHEFGETIVLDNGGVIEGELEIDNIDDYFGGRMDGDGEADGMEGDTSTDSGNSTESDVAEDDDAEDGDAEDGDAEDGDAEVHMTTSSDTRNMRNVPAPAHASRRP